jgi:hypothetical protein
MPPRPHVADVAAALAGVQARLLPSLGRHLRGGGLHGSRRPRGIVEEAARIRSVMILLRVLHKGTIFP